MFGCYLVRDWVIKAQTSQRTWEWETLRLFPGTKGSRELKGFRVIQERWENVKLVSSRLIEPGESSRGVSRPVPAYSCFSMHFKLNGLQSPALGHQGQKSSKGQKHLG